MRRATERGQLAVGLAFAFTCVIALFGMIFNSSMLTLEKMKLQQTTDVAALGASNLQRFALNRIRNINQSIEVAYNATLTALNTMNCLTLILAFTNECTTVNVRATAAAQAMGHPATSPLCRACSDFDAAMADTLIKAYNIYKGQAVAEIIDLIGKTNGKAQGLAMDTFLSPKNLPNGVRGFLKNRNPASLTLANVKGEYQSGTLNDIYDIHNSSEQIPLFMPAVEPRLFKYLKYNYSEGGIPGFCVCVFIPDFPGITPTSVKIVRDGNFTTNFLAAADYTPPNTIFDKQVKLFLKHPDSTRPGRGYDDLETVAGGKVALFKTNDTSTGSVKQTLQTMALAKPFGGTFPTKGDITGLISVGSPGNEFTGSKLIGIADRAQLEGFDLRLNGRIAAQDRPGGEPVFQEDFLH